MRRAIARFRSLGPDIVILRTSTAVVARLRFTEYAAPAGLRVVCDAKDGQEWLLAALLYVVQFSEKMPRQDSLPNRQSD
jgi:hypothetical protein